MLWIVCAATFSETKSITLYSIWSDRVWVAGIIIEDVCGVELILDGSKCIIAFAVPLVFLDSICVFTGVSDDSEHSDDKDSLEISEFRDSTESWVRVNLSNSQNLSVSSESSEQ